MGEIDGFAKMSKSQLMSIVRTRKEYLSSGLQVLYQVHRQISSKTGQKRRLPTLKELRNSVQAGSAAAEE